MPIPVKVARGLFFLNGAIWIIFGIASLVRMVIGETNPTTTILFVALFMFANAAFMFLLGWGIGQQRRSFLYFALLVLAVNIFLTITDEFGTFDFIILLLNIALLALLIATRARYTS